MRAALLLCLLAMACTPAQRLERLVRKHPELAGKDTLVVIRRDTVPGASADTAFYFYQRDTVVIRDRTLTMKYYIKGDSTVYLYGRCDTVVRVDTIRIPYQKVVVAPQEKPSLFAQAWVYVKIFLILFGLAALLLLVFGRRLV